MSKRTPQLLTALLTLSFAACQVGAQEAVADRFRFVEDKFKTGQFLDPPGGHFLLDVVAASNKNTFKVIDEINDTSKKPGTDDEKLQRAQDFIQRYKDTEQFVRLDGTIGIPFPDFRLWGIRFDTNLRATVGGGMLLSMAAERITADNVAAFVGSSVPDDIRRALVDNFDSIDEGDDIIQRLIDDGHIDAGYASLAGKYFMPEKDTETATVETYFTQENRYGFYTDYRINRRWDGMFNVYLSEREDFLIKADSQTIYQNGRTLTERPDESNATKHINVDYFLRYTNGKLRILAGVEEIAVSEVSNNEEKGGTLIYERKPLARLHGDYARKLGDVDARFFLGVHGRKGYSFGDGLYGGIISEMSAYGDRVAFGLGLRLDQEYATLSPGIRLWGLHLDYALKQPLASESDGIKLSAMHSAHLRVAF